MKKINIREVGAVEVDIEHNKISILATNGYKLWERIYHPDYFNQARESILSKFDKEIKRRAREG